MFLDIFNWMLAHAPGFLRPALGWLIDGLRSITNYISARWTSLGSIAQYWRAKLTYWYHRALDFAITLALFLTWLVLVFVPAKVSVAVNAVLSRVNFLVGQAIALARAGLAELGRWAREAIGDVVGLLARLRDFARYWIDKLVVGLRDLIRALAHVLSGPDALAEWLAGAMWRALARLVYSQRDRIVSWLTRESVAFTRWLALQVEDILLRWL